MKQTGWAAAKFLSAKTRNSRRSRFFSVFFATAIAIVPAPALTTDAHAEPAQQAALTPGERADVKRAERYLNDLKTLKARFLQVSSQGGYAEGLIYISRPGKMRIDYAPPARIEIVANDGTLIYHDKELEQISEVDLEDTPANVLLQKNVELTDGPLRVTAVARGNAILRLNVVKKKDPMEGSVTLVFSDKPLALKKWTITDAQGVVTTVSLLRTRFGVPIEPKVFEFEDPMYELKNMEMH